MNIEGKQISVIGAGRSGVGAAKLVKKVGGIPFVSDSGDVKKNDNSFNDLKENNIEFETGKHSNKVYDCSMMIVSPGVPFESKVLSIARGKNIKMFSEIEFAYHYCEGKIIAITGTNGKTTTTSLCGHIFNTCDIKTHVAGNIGLAFSEISMDVKKNEFVALEVSSFQLDLIDKFKPEVAVILNITPDHLDRYENKLENYAESKQRIYKNQDEDDYLILNSDNEAVTSYLKEHSSKSFYFSLDKHLENGCFVDRDDVIFAHSGVEQFRCKRNDIKIRGEHNLANAMAVINAAKVYELNNEKIVRALQSFESVEHRLELVREIGGVKFINDSKATNVDSVWYALRSFDEPVFLILGGQDKGNDYNQVKNLALERVKKIYAIGSSAEKIFNFFHKDIKVEIKDSMEHVVNSVIHEAREGDVVLLSPACASFDMYENYEQRGRAFKEAVNNL